MEGLEAHVTVGVCRRTQLAPPGFTGFHMGDGGVVVKYNDFQRQYNRACSKIPRVKRRSDVRVMAKYQQKAWSTYRNRVKNALGVEARQTAIPGLVWGMRI